VSAGRTLREIKLISKETVNGELMGGWELRVSFWKGLEWQAEGRAARHNGKLDIKDQDGFGSCVSERAVIRLRVENWGERINPTLI